MKLRLPVMALCGLPALAAAAEDPFAGLIEETRPLSTRWQVDYSSQVEVGAGYISDDNFMFGQYNGRHEEGAVFIGNLKWRGSKDSNYWEVTGSDLGLDTRSAGLRWGSAGKFELNLTYDSQLQVRNNTGRTPYSGSSSLVLPADWVPSNITSGFATLDASLADVERELERDKYGLNLAAALSDNWSVDASLSYEEKEGTSDVGAAFYIDASAGHSAILPLNIDYDTTEFSLALNYQGSKLQLTGSWFYSDFDNNDVLQLWQNPYNAFFGSVNHRKIYGIQP